jgi:para-aminobenzoate synthetase component 1
MILDWSEYVISSSGRCFEEMNRFGKKRIPFLFILDFECRGPVLVPLDRIEATGILYSMEGNTNVKSEFYTEKKELIFKKKPVSFSTYRKSFRKVMEHLLKGNSYLVNLTFPTPLESSHALEELFHLARARFRLLVPGRFTVFSPEVFVRIKDGRIYAYPMKGTADASDPEEAEKILGSIKEQAEHHTIVDLIRNDLSQIADDVSLERFAYREIITTHEKQLIQVSSEISGRLFPNYHEHLGDIFKAILPAGSVTGAPKAKTLEIIREAEIYERGYYTGVFGIFDGSEVNSAVMIRFIEQTPQGYLFKSGGGITAYSDPRQEYKEIIDKVYVPVA